VLALVIQIVRVSGKSRGALMGSYGRGRMVWFGSGDAESGQFQNSNADGLEGAPTSDYRIFPTQE
jgi:hypothetical protein